MKILFLQYKLFLYLDIQVCVDNLLHILNLWTLWCGKYTIAKDRDILF